MSNRSPLFFLAVSITFGGLLSHVFATPQDSLVEQAHKDFLYENFRSAVQNYSLLVEQGQDDQQLFYRLAYLHEQLQQYPEAVYYLRKLQWATDDPVIADKLTDVLEQSDFSLPEGEPASFWTLSMVHHARWWMIGIGLLWLLSGGVLLLKSWNLRTRFAMAFSSVALVATIVYVMTVQLYVPRAVIVVPTYYYESPSYGAARISLPVTAGSVVKLMEKKDIWQRISVDNKDSWVPAFVLAPLDEWE